MYNKDKMKQISDSVKSFDYLKSINFSGERTGQPFTLDTSTLEITFNLPPKKKAEISHAVGGQRIIPDYSLLKRIAVSYNNQKKEYYQNVLDTLFKEQKSGAWQFSIN
jgi:hypothetical protein